MIIYETEVKDGVGELVKANKSIAYHSLAKPFSLDEKFKDVIQRVVAASNPNQKDLFYLDTILVSTGCNKNKDIFDKTQTWAARHTAEDKPFNLNHVQTDIIGHMTSNFAVSENHSLIPDNSSIDDVPDKFHIVTGAVIYKFWEDENRRNSIAKIIDEIDKGEWFVSMECLFSDFDYGLISTTGEQRIVARNAESSFLTKHLAQYGGSGKYQDYSLGRVLKNITFSGKGLVRTPANPESKILNDVTSFKSLGYINSSSLIKSGDKKMTDETLIAELKKQNADLVKQLNETNVKAKDEKIAELTKALEAAVAAKNAAEEDEKKTKKDYEAKSTEMAAQLKELAEAKDKAEKDKKDAEDKMDQAKCELKLISRQSAAVSAGAKEDDAKAFAKKYESLPDEAYADMISYASHTWKKDETAPTSDTAANASEKVIANADKPKEEVVPAGDVKNMETTMAAVVDYLRNFKKENK